MSFAVLTQRTSELPRACIPGADGQPDKPAFPAVKLHRVITPAGHTQRQLFNDVKAFLERQKREPSWCGMRLMAKRTADCSEWVPVDMGAEREKMKGEQQGPQPAA
ncbi:hypothetical protein HYH02_004868 [Chlamydomonas schloesseri]|nr:hypothetical protein HYH02_004868 [Chlamydomonas schloesseri]|eukprot:KAG2450363.1 hypothetical protein HYH02_004868 [Chlamydomonas schloesseri]